MLNKLCYLAVECAFIRAHRDTAAMCTYGATLLRTDSSQLEVGISLMKPCQKIYSILLTELGSRHFARQRLQVKSQQAQQQQPQQLWKSESGRFICERFAY